MKHKYIIIAIYEYSLQFCLKTHLNAISHEQQAGWKL